MTATTPDTEQLRELEAELRHAWEHYSETLRELSGEEYERVETASWDELQSELERLERRREGLRPAAV